MNGRICCSRTYQTNQTDRNDKQIKRATFYGQPATKSLNKKILHDRRSVVNICMEIDTLFKYICKSRYILLILLKQFCVKIRILRLHVVSLSPKRSKICYSNNDRYSCKISAMRIKKSSLFFFYAYIIFHICILHNCTTLVEPMHIVFKGQFKSFIPQNLLKITERRHMYFEQLK